MFISKELKLTRWESEHMTKSYDVIVIGSGLSGLTIAYGLNKKGLSVAIVEANKFGGAVANYGSTRKKELVAFAELKLTAQQLAKTGAVNELTPNWQSAMAYIDSLENTESLEHETALRKVGIDTIYGEAIFVDEHHIEVAGSQYEGEKFVIATGAKSRTLQIEGSDYLKDSTDFLTQKELPKKVIFIGAGIIAFAFMTIAEAFDTEVTVLQHDERALAAFDQELVYKLIELNKSRGINYHFDEQLIAVKKNQDNYSAITAKGIEYQADAIYCVAGRIPNISDLGIETIGIETDQHGIVVDEYLTTNISTIYACGDCSNTPVPKLATYAVWEADYLVEHLTGDGLKNIDYPLSVMSTFSQPKLAQVGISISHAKENQELYSVETIDMTDWLEYKKNNDAIALVKVIYQKSDNRIVGATSLSNQADLFINYFTMALHAGWTKAELKKIIFAYPSLANDVLRAYH